MLITTLTLLASFTFPPNPLIPLATYSPEREKEILAQFNALLGSQKQCGNGFIKAYQKALYDYCKSTDGGKNVGGGCEHVAYAWSVHTRVLELAIEQCAKPILEQ